MTTLKLVSQVPKETFNKADSHCFPLIRFRIVKVLSRNALSVASLLFSSKFCVGIASEPPIWFRFIPFANYVYYSTWFLAAMLPFPFLKVICFDLICFLLAQENMTTLKLVSKVPKGPFNKADSQLFSRISYFYL